MVLPAQTRCHWADIGSDEGRSRGSSGHLVSRIGLRGLTYGAGWHSLSNWVLGCWVPLSSLDSQIQVFSLRSVGCVCGKSPGVPEPGPWAKRILSEVHIPLRTELKQHQAPMILLHH